MAASSVRHSYAIRCDLFLAVHFRSRGTGAHPGRGRQRGWQIATPHRRDGKMSAREVTDEVIARMASYDLIILNFANPDMVGHTGILKAGIKAVETVDECVARIIPKLLDLDGKCIVTADHGNW